MPDSFDDRVREAVACTDCPEDFAIEVLTRLDGGELSLLAMAYLLLETPVGGVGGGWGSLREALVSDLAGHPNDAMQVFNVAVSALHWPPLAMGETRREGPPFMGSVRITPRGAEVPIEASAEGPTVKLALHRSAVVLLAALAEVNPPTFDGIEPRVMPPRTSGKARPLPTESDPIAWLHTHAGRFHMKQPRTQRMVLVGGQHRVVLRYSGMDAAGSGTTKKAAKREACAKLRERILAGEEALAKLVPSVGGAAEPCA